MSSDAPNTPSSPSCRTRAPTPSCKPADACFCRSLTASKQSLTTTEKSSPLTPKSQPRLGRYAILPSLTTRGNVASTNTRTASSDSTSKKVQTSLCCLMPMSKGSRINSTHAPERYSAIRHLARFSPTPRLCVLHFTVEWANWQQDPFGNFLARIVFPEKTSEFRIEVDLLTELRPFNLFDFFLEDYAKEFPFAYEQSLKEELAPYLEIKEAGIDLRAWLDALDISSQGIIDFLVATNQKVNRTLRYTCRPEPGIQTCEETLILGSGSCRDMTWFLCQGLRHLGLATRFASGYLIQ